MSVTHSASVHNFSMPDLLTITELSKTYVGVTALSNLSLTVRAGEVLAVCGENGAGKSTLIKCLAGVTTPDSGEVKMGQDVLPFGNVAAAEARGIAVIHQESTGFPDLNAVDNIFVGHELTNRFGLLDHPRMRQTAVQLLARLGQSLDVTLPLRDLPLANQQMVAMARALSRQCKLMIMDEPTASLSARETDVLLQTVRQLQTQGVAIVYVSHRLPEVFELADRILVLRDGQHVTTQARSEMTENALIQHMVGREPNSTASPRQQREFGEARLEVRDLTGRSFANISLTLRAGEIVGLAGLVGAGRSEFARATVGLDPYVNGNVLVCGQPLAPCNVRASLASGLALVPEDRQHEGLVLPMSVGQNISLAVLQRLSSRGIVNRNAEQQVIHEMMESLRVKAPHANVATESLSGGNQQKVVLAKWLATKPSVLILDEPTRGVDVGAKAQVHELIHELASQGMATLMISSELPELLAVCDRILVMSQGRLVGEVDASSATQAQILQLALPDSPANTSSTSSTATTTITSAHD